MADNVLSLIFRIAAHPEEAIEALQEFHEKAGESLAEVGKAAETTQGAMQQLTGFIRSHLIFSVDEFVRLTHSALEAAKSAAEFGEQVANLSEATGIGARQISGLEFAVKQTGLHTDILDRALRQLARNISPLASSGSEGAKAMQALGISVTDASGHMKPLHELLLEVADAFHSHRDSAEKAAAAQALFGRSGAEMIPLLDRGRAGILAMEKAANDLGVTLSDEDARRLREMNEELKLNEARLKGVELSISEFLLPTFVRLANLLTFNKDTWRIWGLNIEAVFYGLRGEIENFVSFLLSRIPGIGKLLAGTSVDFAAAAKEDIQQMHNLETETLLIQQHYDDLLKAFEGGEKGKESLSLPFLAGAKAAKSHADALTQMLTREKEELQSFNDSLEPSLRRIDLAYQRQVDAARKAIEADREQLREKKITITEEQRAEQEYSEFLDAAIKLRDAKWNEELRKIEERLQTIAAEIAQRRQQAEQELQKQIAQQAPQGPQANIFGAQMSGLTTVFAQMANAAVPAVTRQKAAVESLKNALLGLPPVLTDVAQKHELMAGMSQHFADAMGANIAQAIVYGASIKEAMERALKATLESIAAKAIVQAIYSTALGFLLLAEMNFSGAAQAFEAATVFGLVGGAAAAVGAAVPGGNSSVQRYQADRVAANAPQGPPQMSSGMAGITAAQQQQISPQGRVTVMVMGESNAAQWLTQTINKGVQQQGLQLQTTRSKMPTYAGR
ncbi:MAG TPA: phage tail tape measure protein [Terriglobia bacterium]|nr:phage tail tape measure protein [Terriglobia bacterium]